MMHDSKGVARLFAAPFAIWAAIFIVLPLFFVFYHGLTDGEGAFTLANLWCTSQQKLDTKNKIFFRFNPKFGQLRIVHDTVVVLSTLRNKLVALH